MTADRSPNEDNKIKDSGDAMEGDENLADSFSLLIIKSSTQAMKGPETFLRNRKWELSTCVNLKEALTILIQKQPKFVMISVDHPNKKVRVLPKVLKQAFPVTTILFAEQQSNNSIKALHESGSEYTIFPPVSGPAIERTILKILRDQKKKEQDEKDRIARGEVIGTEQDSIISIKGGGQPVDKAEYESARAALTQLLNSDETSTTSGSSPDSGMGYIPQGGVAQNNDPSAMNTLGKNPNEPNYSSSDLQKSGDMYVQKGQKQAGGMGYIPQSQGQQGQSGYNPNQEGQTQGHYYNPDGSLKNPMGYMPNQAQKDGTSGYNPNQQEQAGTNGYLPNQQNQATSNEGYGTNQSGAGKASEGYNPNQAANDAGVFYPNQEEDDGSGFMPTHIKKKHYDIEYGKKREDKQTRPRYYNPEEYDPATVPNYENDDLKNALQNLNKPKEQNDTAKDTDSIILKGTQKALDESVVVKEGYQQNLKSSSNVACITIESTRFSGYLIAALGKNRKIDKTFIETVKAKLFTFLRENGEKVDDSESMDIKLQEVEFKDWALEYAEFLRKSIHDGNEIAMAFFPTSTRVDLSDSKSEKMVMLSMDDIKADTPVEFDLYIFLPENNKYLLYTPQGRVFLGEQKKRLVEKGVTHLHLRKENIQNVKKYRAQNYLNDKILSYKQKKAKESDVAG